MTEDKTLVLSALNRLIDKVPVTTVLSDMVRDAQDYRTIRSYLEQNNPAQLPIIDGVTALKATNPGLFNRPVKSIDSIPLCGGTGNVQDQIVKYPFIAGGHNMPVRFEFHKVKSIFIPDHVEKTVIVEGILKNRADLAPLVEPDCVICGGGGYVADHLLDVKDCKCNRPEPASDFLSRGEVADYVRDETSKHTNDRHEICIAMGGAERAYDFLRKFLKDGLETAAEMHDEAERDMRKIRDVGMANHHAKWAEKFRDEAARKYLALQMKEK